MASPPLITTSLQSYHNVSAKRVFCSEEDPLQMHIAKSNLQIWLGVVSKSVLLKLKNKKWNLFRAISIYGISYNWVLVVIMMVRVMRWRMRRWWGNYFREMLVERSLQWHFSMNFYFNSFGFDRETCEQWETGFTGCSMVMYFSKAYFSKVNFWKHIFQKCIFWDLVNAWLRDMWAVRDWLVDSLAAHLLRLSGDGDDDGDNDRRGDLPIVRFPDPLATGSWETWQETYYIPVLPSTSR